MVFGCIAKNFPENIFWCLKKKMENSNQKMQNNTNQKNTSHKSRKTQIQNNTSKLRLVHSKIFTENASNQAKETKTQQKKCNQFFNRAVDRRSRRRAVRVRRARSSFALLDRQSRRAISSIALRDLVDRATRRRGTIVGRAARSGLSLLSFSLSLIWALSSLSLFLSLSFSGSYLK